jgi:hypothetical protein
MRWIHMWTTSMGCRLRHQIHGAAEREGHQPIEQASLGRSRATLLQKTSAETKQTGPVRTARESVCASPHQRGKGPESWVTGVKKAQQ